MVVFLESLGSPGGRRHRCGGENVSSSSSERPGERNYIPSNRKIYQLLPLAGWRRDLVCQRDGSGSFSWLYHRMPAGEGWLAGAAAGLHPDGRVVASHQEGELNEHLAEPQPRGHSTLGLQGRQATVGDVCPEQVGPLDDLVEGEDFGQALHDVDAIDQVGLLYLVFGIPIF